jgi:hypothetical protein
MPLSKATRFEVFKRDKFTCQYCGKKAPDVVLECDHIHPRAQGGSNDPVNLVTACHACNNGKGARTLSDDSVVAKQHAQLAQLQERREQLEMMMEWQRGLVDLDGEAANAINELYRQWVKGWSLTPDGVADVKRYLKDYSVEDIATILRESVTKHMRTEDGKATQESAEIVCRVFLNEHKYRKRREKDPVGSDLAYVMGMVKNRCPTWRRNSPGICMNYLRNAYEEGVTIAELKTMALSSWGWNQWELAICEEIIARRKANEVTDGR